MLKNLKENYNNMSSRYEGLADKWDRRFLDLAAHISTWSKDPSTQVGAVLVNPENNLVVGIGYNGFARGVKDTEERLTTRDLKYKLVVHAEVNAILMAKEQAKGAKLYVYPAFNIPNCCHDCTKTAIQAGVSEIISYTPTPAQLEKSKGWSDSIAIARQMCDEAGVKYRGVDA